MKRQITSLVIIFAIVVIGLVQIPARAQSGSKTRVVDRLVDGAGSPRRGKVTFILTRKASSPGGIIPVGATVSATLDTAGYFDISVYASAALTPATYYQVWYAGSDGHNELIGIYNIPTSANIVSLSAYRVTDTNLAAQYTFASVTDVDALVTAVSTATLARLNGVSHANGAVQVYKSASGALEDSAIVDTGSAVNIGRATNVTGALTTTGNGTIGGNANVSGAGTFGGAVTAPSFIGDGAGITGLTGATGGVANTGSTTIGADTDSNDVGDIALQTKGTTRIRIKPSGQIEMAGMVIIGGCAGTDDSTLLSAAVSTASGGSVVIPNGQTCAGNDITIPNLRIEKGGFLKPVTGHTVTLTNFQGGGVGAAQYQVFTNALATQGTIAVTGTVYPDWWKANATPGTTDMTAAITAADTAVCNGDLRADLVTVAAQGNVKFLPTVYKLLTGVIYRGAPWSGDDSGETILDYYGSGAAVTAVGSTSARKLLSITRLAITGTHSSGGAQGLVLGWNMRSLPALSKVIVDHFPADGIYFADDEWDLSFDHVSIINNATASGAGIGFAAVNDSNEITWYKLQCENNGQSGSSLGGCVDNSTTGVGALHQWNFNDSLFTSNLGAGEVRFSSGANIKISGGYVESAGTGDLTAGLVFTNVTAVTIDNVSMVGAANTGKAIRFTGSTTGKVDTPRIHTNWSTKLSSEDTARMDVPSVGNLVPGTSVVFKAPGAQLNWPMPGPLPPFNWGDGSTIYGSATYDIGEAIVQSNTGKTLSLGSDGHADKAVLNIAGDMEMRTAGRGVVLKSPDGTLCKRLTIDNAGATVLTTVTCP